MQAGFSVAIIASRDDLERIIHKLFLTVEENRFRRAPVPIRKQIISITIEVRTTCMSANWKAETLSAPPSTAENSLITAEKLKQLYERMIQLRVLDERLRRKSSQPRFHEACEVGCTVDLRQEDLISTLPDQHVSYVSRGVKPADYLQSGIRRRHASLLNIFETFSLNVIDARNDRLSRATGASFAFKAQRSANVVVAFCRPQEVLRSQDCIYFATLQRLPIIYVQLSDSSFKSRNQHLKYPSITLIPVEQNDVVATYRVASEAVDKARRRVGPTLIRCVNYSSSTRNGLGTRCSDPILYLEHYLHKRNLWSADAKNTIEESFSRELNEALQSSASSRR